MQTIVGKVLLENIRDSRAAGPTRFDETNGKEILEAWE